MNKNAKKGITLMILVITIIIIAILLGVGIYGSMDLVDTSSIADFRTTMSEIEDLVKTYKLANGTMPVTESSPITYDDIASGLSLEASPYFAEQVEANKDEESLFYYVDFAKINVIQAGFDVEGKVVVNEEGTCVYYTPGMYISGNWYFTDYSYDIY